MCRLILASASPRRRELLKRLNLVFDLYEPNLDETCQLPPGEAVTVLARRKALSASAAFPQAYILAADTLVSVDGRSLGKPSDQEDAIHMLRLLSGRTHQVFTGVSVVSPSGKVFSGMDETNVTFCEIPEGELVSYVQSSEPYDKAGAYALQGRASAWVIRLSGSDTSVIGLPLYLVRELLLQAGYSLENIGMNNKIKG